MHQFEGQGNPIFGTYLPTFCRKGITCFLQKDKTVKFVLKPGYGVYLYVLEGGPVSLNDTSLPQLASAKITDEKKLVLTAVHDAELLLVDTAL